MTRDEFQNGVAKNVARVREYELGHDGTGGTCDCIGLIVGAVRLSGGSWTGTHGSNYAARNAVDNLRKVSNINQLNIGDLVFKGKQPSDSGYALPSKYKSSGDLTDYYHVGVVTCVSPFEITHCTGVSGGIKRDTKLGNWGYAGALKMLSDKKQGGDTMEGLYMAEVYAANGGDVNLRETADKNGKQIKKVPVGTSVTVLEECDDEWAGVQAGSRQGYMMRKFLRASGGISQTPNGNDEAFEKLMQAQQLINEVIGLLGGAVG